MPLGYRRGADGRPVIDEPGAETVRRIFAESVAGRSTLDIANGLTVDGVPTPNGRGRGMVSLSTVSRILKVRRAYAGSWTYADTDVEVDIPADSDQLRRLKPLRTRSGRVEAAPGATRRPNRYLLAASGLVRGLWSEVHQSVTRRIEHGVLLRLPRCAERSGLPEAFVHPNADRLDAMVWDEVQREFLTRS